MLLLTLIGARMVLVALLTEILFLVIVEIGLKILDIILQFIDLMLALLNLALLLRAKVTIHLAVTAVVDRHLSFNEDFLPLHFLLHIVLANENGVDQVLDVFQEALDSNNKFLHDLARQIVEAQLEALQTRPKVEQVPIVPSIEQKFDLAHIVEITNHVFLHLFVAVSDLIDVSREDADHITDIRISRLNVAAENFHFLASG